MTNSWRGPDYASRMGNILSPDLYAGTDPGLAEHGLIMSFDNCFLVKSGSCHNREDI
jgi:hypothetical protein